MIHFSSCLVVWNIKCSFSSKNIGFRIIPASIFQVAQPPGRISHGFYPSSHGRTPMASWKPQLSIVICQVATRVPMRLTVLWRFQGHVYVQTRLKRKEARDILVVSIITVVYIYVMYRMYDIQKIVIYYILLYIYITYYCMYIYIQHTIVYVYIYIHIEVRVRQSHLFADRIPHNTIDFIAVKTKRRDCFTL